MFPALALLMATAPTPRLSADLRATGIGMAALGVLLLAGAALLPRILAAPSLHDPLTAPYFLRIRPALLLMGACSAAGGLAAWRAARTAAADAGDRPGRLCGLDRCDVGGGRAWRRSIQARRLYAQLPDALRRDVPVYSVRTYDQSLTFYLGHPVTLVEYRGELDFGQTLEPHAVHRHPRGLRAAVADSAQALAVMEQKTYQQMQRRRICRW